MREYRNTRNPILPLDLHIPDAEAHVMPNVGALCDDGNGVRELKLCFTQAENLKIRAITLFEKEGE